MPIVRFHWTANCLMQWFNTLRSLDYNNTFFWLELACVADVSIFLGQVGQAQKVSEAKRTKAALQARLECIAMHT